MRQRFSNVKDIVYSLLFRIALLLSLEAVFYGPFFSRVY